MRHTVYSINTTSKSAGISVEEEIRNLLKEFNPSEICVSFPLTKTLNEILFQKIGIQIEQILELRYMEIKKDIIPGRWIGYSITNLLFYSAKKFWRLGNFVKAEQRFLKALRRNPRHIPTLMLYALFLKKVHKNSIECGNYLKKAVESNPLNADSLGNYALFLESIGKIKESENYFLEALHHVPDNANVLCNYAVFLKNVKHQPEKARLYYEKAIKENPNHVNARGNCN